MTARALCSVLVFVLGLYFVIAALASLPSQLAMLDLFSTTEAQESYGDAGSMMAMQLQFVLALGWQLLVGVVIVVLRNNIATAFVPLDDDGDEESSPATAIELRAIGVLLIGVYLVATGVSEILALKSVERVGDGFWTYATYAWRTVIGLSCAIWGYRTLSPTASRSDDDDWDDADYERDDVDVA